MTIEWVDSVYRHARLIVNVNGTTYRYPVHAEWVRTGVRSPEKFVLPATNEGYRVSFSAEFADERGVVVAKARSETQDRVPVSKLPITKKACQLNLVNSVQPRMKIGPPIGTVVYSIEPVEN